MTRLELVLTDEDHARFVRQAEREGMSLEAWLHAAAHARLARRRAPRRLLSAADPEAFFARCDAQDGPAVEPDWEEHLAVIDKSRMRGRAPT